MARQKYLHMLQGIEIEGPDRLASLIRCSHLFIFLLYRGLIRFLLLTYKIVVSCALDLEVLQNNMHAN
jgi:hypothetical protein